MKSIKLLLLVALLNLSFSYSQNILEGRVTNVKEKPVANVKIYFDSIYSNIKTNKDGYYKVELPDKVDFINVFSTKYGLLSSKYTNEDIMNFVYLNKLKSKKFKNERELNLGYDNAQKKYVVHSVDNFDAEMENDIVLYRTIYDMIRGRVPGVTVTRNNQIIIRGVNSVRNVSEPLFVVDGSIVSSIDYIFPTNVKDINVLKGSAASIYGAQAAGGVIVITTKTSN